MSYRSNFSSGWDCCSEEELWKAFCEDNREALSNLFLRFYEQLFRYGMSFSSDEDIVKDSIQKLFFRLWQKRKVISVPQSIPSYLYVSLRRILLRKKKRKTARGKRNLEYLDLEFENLYSVEEQIVLREEKEKREELFQYALDSLAPRQKEAILLRVDSGMSNREIAEIMGVSDKRIRNLIYEATKRLRQEIKKLTEQGHF
jgi:RNA polymerase sigma factor (sigma-70 family)